MLKIHERLHLAEDGVTLDGQPLIVEDGQVVVEHIDDDLSIVRLGILVGKVTVDPPIEQTITTTYSRPRHPSAP